MAPMKTWPNGSSSTKKWMAWAKALYDNSHLLIFPLLLTLLVILLLELNAVARAEDSPHTPAQVQSVELGSVDQSAVKDWLDQAMASEGFQFTLSQKDEWLYQKSGAASLWVVRFDKGLGGSSVSVFSRTNDEAGLARQTLEHLRLQSRLRLHFEAPQSEVAQRECRRRSINEQALLPVQSYNGDNVSTAKECH